MFQQPIPAIPTDPSFEPYGWDVHDGGSGAMGGGFGGAMVGGALAFQPQGQESDPSDLDCHTMPLDAASVTITDSDDDPFKGLY